MMKLICLVKFVPDVDNFKYDFERNVLIRENVNMVLNPDDAKAIAFALKVKALNPEITVEILSMGPKSVVPMLENLLRLKIDKATLISDPLYVGSDTYVTSHILAKYINSIDYDCILSGTHSLDGDTSHVPSQIAEYLSIHQCSNVLDVDKNFNKTDSFSVSVDSENFIETYEVSLPILLSFSKESKLKLPYVRYEDMHKDVSDKLMILNNEVLRFDKHKVGLEGSLTKVSRSFVKPQVKKDKIVVKSDYDGVMKVYRTLKQLGYLK
jgi:electron transfer flavoprotein beta subunit